MQTGSKNYKIIKYYGYTFFKNSIFFFPIIVLFFMNNNISFTEIFFLETVGAIGFVILEVPTGAIADYFGKKTSVALGSSILILSSIVFYINSTFIMFLLARLLWSLGGTLLSGADTALLYDIIYEDRKEEFKKYQGNARFLGLIGIASSSLIGGYIASYSLRSTFLMTIISLILCFIIIMSIKHIEMNKSSTNYGMIIKNSYIVIKTNHWLLWLFLFAGILGTIFGIIKPLSQVYMNDSGIGVEFFGIASTYYFLAAAIASKLAHRFEKIFKKWSYFVLGSIFIITLIFVGTIMSKWGFILFGFIFIAMSITTIIVEHEILRITPNEMHSTILSFGNLLERLIFVFVSPIFGYTLEIFTFQKAILGVAIILIVFIIGFIHKFSRVYKIRNRELGQKL